MCELMKSLEPFLPLTLGLIKFSQISFSLVGVGRGGTKKPASRLKKPALATWPNERRENSTTWVVI